MPDLVLKVADDLEAALSRPRALLFKHKTTCPISKVARAEFEMFKVDHPDAPTLFIDVINAQPLARMIAQKYGIENESPQIILFEDQIAVWHATDAQITCGAIEAAWSPKC
jgi:bacillithiol system protein YtxJ